MTGDNRIRRDFDLFRNFVFCIFSRGTFISTIDLHRCATLCATHTLTLRETATFNFLLLRQRPGENFSPADDA